jgi:hypothetical protein
MAPEDRDRNFEKALARQMRANAPEAFNCPDAETLAAYHSRMLSPEEMAAQKSHIAACPRCQEILATLEITEAIPVEAEENQKTFAKAASKALAAVHATPMFSQSAQTASPKTKSPQVAQMPKRKPYLRWALPAGAIAAGLLLWISINNRWTAHKQAQPSASVEVAENRDQKTPELLTVKPADELAAPAPPSKPLEQTKEEGRARQKLDAAGGVAGQDKIAAMGGANGRVYEHGPRMAQNQAQNLNQNLNLNQAQNGIQNQTGNLSKNNEAFRAPATEPAPTNAPQRAEQYAKAVPAPAPPPASVANRKEQDEEKKRANAEAQRAQRSAGASADLDARKDTKADSAVSSAEVGEGAPIQTATKVKSAAKGKKESEAETKMLKRLESSQLVAGMSAASLRDTNTFEEGFLHTPDPQVFWFVAPSGQIFRTEDAGKTIHPQEIGMGIKALTGSAPDARTCWLVARSGSVLLTVDGGKHWRTLPTPESVTFSSVKAIDALNASISDASGQTRYTTSDGGVTWVLVTKP